MKPVFADTSYYIALLSEEDAYHVVRGHETASPHKCPYHRRAFQAGEFSRLAARIALIDNLVAAEANA